MINPRLIRWIKSVSLDEDLLAYAGRDPTVLAREPRRAGDLFELHSAEDDLDGLADPAVGEIIGLAQHKQLTHLVEVVGAGVVDRPKATIRPKTRDVRFCVERTCKLLLLRDFEEAPSLEEAFGFDPRAEGGEVLEIAALPAFEAAATPLWMVQRRILRAMEGELPSVKARLLRLRQRAAKDGGMVPLEEGKGRVPRGGSDGD